jgi:urease accessory protein
VGSATDRITADDFVIPPELHGLRLAQHAAGQIGGVRLELIPGPPARRGRTTLGACYQQTPVRVLPPFHFTGEPAALLYLLNPTAGLMDGDGHAIEIAARSGSRTVVTGQSATRIHPACSSFSAQQWSIRVENGADLVVLPGPVIPFRGCRYTQRVRIDLDPGARLIWADIWLPGRYARGEQSEGFQFDRIIQHLEVYRAERLVFRERFCWQGPWSSETVRWRLGSGQATGSLFVTGAFQSPADRAVGGLLQAVLPLASGDACLRWCGSPAEVIAAVVGTAFQLPAMWAGAGTPWLGGGHLAPNHWFSTAAVPASILAARG